MGFNIKKCGKCGESPQLVKGKYPYEDYFRLRCVECGYGTDSLKDLSAVIDNWNRMNTDGMEDVDN